MQIFSKGVMLLHFVVLAFSVAFTTPAVSDGGSSCSEQQYNESTIGLSLSTLERDAWYEVCKTGEATLGKCIKNASKNDSKTQQGHLSSKFFELLITNPPSINGRKRHDVELNCGSVGQLDLKYISTKIAIKVQNFTFHGKVDLSGSNFESNLEINSTQFRDSVFFNHARFGRGLYLKNNKLQQKKYFSLLGAHIEGSFSLSGSEVLGKLNADRVIIKSGFFSGPGTTIHDLDLTSAEVNGPVNLLDTTLGGRINFTGSEFDELILFFPTRNKAKEVRWETGTSKLLLRNLRVNSLQARLESFQEENGNWVPTDLSGFRYKHLTGLGGDRGPTILDQPVDNLITWLNEVNPERYDPDPYVHLVGILHRSGHEDKAKAISYAKYERLNRVASFPRIQSPNGGAAEYAAWYSEEALTWTWQRIGWFFSRNVVGYGVYPFRALWWFAGIVLLGFMVTYIGNEKNCKTSVPLYGVIDCFWFSLENTMPLVQLSERYKNFEPSNTWIIFILRCQKILGFVIASYLIGVLTL